MESKLFEIQQVEVEEVVAIRSRCTYWFYEDEPTSGRWWAVRLVPVEFPGEHHATTPDGASVISAVVIACDRRADDGLWQWCHLTPAAKRLWGDMVLAHGDTERWWYVVETAFRAREAGKEE